MRQIGFLHTSAVHVATFTRLVEQTAGPATTVHGVVPELLDRARRTGSDKQLRAHVLDALQHLVERGADAIVCTCSTLGPLTEQVGATLPVPVLRVDRPMAALAVATGRRIGVVAAVESTLRPTLDLIADEARRAGRDPEVVQALVPEAWDAFEAGNEADYVDRIAVAARGLAASVDVIVLAQASMAGALPVLTDLTVPVLASPGSAVEHVLAATRPIPDDGGMTGTVVSVNRDDTHRFSKVPVDSITLATGLGVAGDAHAGTLVQHRSRVRRDPNQPNLRQVHLIHAELFDEARAMGFELGPGDLGENVLTSGIDLLGLPTGTILDFGDAAVRLTGLRNPCAQINTFQPGLLKVVLAKGDGTPTDQPAPSTADPEASKVPFIRKAGVMAVVERGGVVLPGQAVRIMLPEGEHTPLVPV